MRHAGEGQGVGTSGFARLGQRVLQATYRKWHAAPPFRVLPLKNLALLCTSTV
jgi:hypothetical protein